MKSFHNEIVIHRNETFTIDKYLQNKDGSPYILSKKLPHPYFLLSVATSRYEQNNRYIKNWWLNASNFPAFESTQAMNLVGLLNANNEIIQDFADVTDAGIVEVDSEPIQYVAKKQDGNDIIYYEPDDCVFFVRNSNGIQYKYCEIISVIENGSEVYKVQWKNYALRLIKTFSSQDTSAWIEQSYVYSIQLVSGQTYDEYLRSLCRDNNITYNENAANSVLEELLSTAQIEIKQVDKTMPIAQLDTVIMILPPTKLTVLSNLLGGL